MNIDFRILGYFIMFFRVIFSDFMFPNVDPKALKGMLDKLGIKSRSIDSDNVVIHCSDRDIVIDEPEVTLIEGQGMQNFQISGKVSEVAKGNVEVSEDDIRLVQEQTGVEDTALIKKTLEETGGDIAEAILILKSGKG
jgi:nascent polypeptide-associated complex subunit alpha